MLPFGFALGAEIKIAADSALEAGALDGSGAAPIACNASVNVSARRQPGLEQWVFSWMRALGFASGAQVKIRADGAGEASTDDRSLLAHVAHDAIVH